MASLKRPDNCGCGSVRLLKEKNPERYVCLDCREIVVSRVGRPDSSKCNKCGISRSERPFKAGKNTCLDCQKVLSTTYYKDNNQRILEYKKDYYHQNRDMIRGHSNEYWQSTMEIFLGYVYRRCKGTSKKRLNGRRRDIEFNITIQDIKELYDKANGKCAISGLDMTHCWNSLRAVSIDRIDSSHGYIPGNVQLVCMWANLAKQRFSNDDIKTILDDYHSLRKSQESI